MKTFLLSAHLAFVALGRHRLRSALTVLGIVIAVVSITIVSAMGVGAHDEVTRSFQATGVNVMFVYPQNAGPGKGATRLDEDDAAAIARDLPGVLYAGADIIVDHTVDYGGKTDLAIVVGASAGFRSIRKMSIAVGDWWDEQDELAKARVCVIGEVLQAKLFGDMNPLGQSIRINRTPYRVIGVFNHVGTAAPGDDWDDSLLIPISTMRTRVEHLHSPKSVTGIHVQAVSAAAVAQVEEGVANVLRDRHHIRPGDAADFGVRNLTKLMQTQSRTQELITTLLTYVAAIALLVGGIGVTNVMLVNVTERKREIGICLAIGAGPTHIALQFLVEALTLTFFGGLAGVSLGIGGAALVARQYGWERFLDPETVAVGLAASVAVGLVFGFVPAVRAARLDPVAAMRRD